MSVHIFRKDFQANLKVWLKVDIQAEDEYIMSSGSLSRDPYL